LRVDAIVGASFAVLDEWCDGHEDEFIALANQAGTQLAARGSITAQQAASWTVLDGTPSCGVARTLSIPLRSLSSSPR
jgi:hypothetical protein